MAIYLLSNHIGLAGLQVACSLEIVGVRSYFPRSYVRKINSNSNPNPSSNPNRVSIDTSFYNAIKECSV